MLHLTNGDSVAGTLEEAGFGPAIVAWRDVLHEGPVPADLPLYELSAVRAQFIASRGWHQERVRAHFEERDRMLRSAADHDETVLWFEHDLYDQLQLLQILDWFAGQGLEGTQLSMICDAEYLGPVDANGLCERFATRRPVTGLQLNLAREAWAAFRSPDPRSLLPLLGDSSTELPFLGAALLRQLQQFPDAHTGLSRSEFAALDAILAGHSRAKQAYVASHHDREHAIFLGDCVFADYLERMSQERSPLVVQANGERVVVPAGDADAGAFWATELAVTNAGRAVHDALEDRILVNGIDRWLGGVH
ncbi:MAG: DUF1835 domain-containing protein, partial [Gemmatimonadales bacterium]